MRSARLAVRCYRFVLRLYPAPFREEFAAEMEETFEESVRRAASRGAWPLATFCAREAAGLAAGIARERAARESLLAALRAHGAPITAGLAAGGCFLLGAVLAGGAAVFQPALLLLAVAIMAAGSILAGRAWAAPGSLLRRLAWTGAALFLVLAALPAARLADHAWLGLTASSGGEISWALPGIDVEARTVEAGSSLTWEELLPRDRRGYIYSGSLAAGNRNRLAMLWHRLPSSPPYELIIVLAGGALSAASHARRRRGLPPVAR